MIALVAILLAQPIEDTALAECRNAARQHPSREMLTAMLDAEEETGVPAGLRGMVLAAACHESGFSADAIGDGGLAVGLLQMHPWWARAGVQRRDPYLAARAWLERVAGLVGRATRAGCRRPWVAAWAWVAQGPQGYSCRAPRHLAVLRRWQR